MTRPSISHSSTARTIRRNPSGSRRAARRLGSDPDPTTCSGGHAEIASRVDHHLLIPAGDPTTPLEVRQEWTSIRPCNLSLRQFVALGKCQTLWPLVAVRKSGCRSEVMVRSGWEEVYAGQYRRLVALVTAVAGSRPEAEEAVQEAFVRALGLTGRRAVVDDPEAWLYRVAVNVIRSRWRRLLIGRRIAAKAGAASETTPSKDADTDARLALLDALRRLPYEQREALALHYLADLPIEAIAVRLGSPVGTVKARLARGRQALGRLLADDAVKEGERSA